MWLHAPKLAVPSLVLVSALALSPLGAAALPSLYAVAASNSATATRGGLFIIVPGSLPQLVGQPVATGLNGLGFESSGRLFAATGNYAGLPVASSLLEIDPDDGSLLSSIAITDSLGASLSILDLAFQPGTDVLFATTWVADDFATQVLYTIDVATGVATPFGDTGIQSGVRGGSLAFTPAGALYYAVFDPVFEETNLHELDPLTGQNLGSLPFGGGSGSLVGGPDGLLYSTGLTCCGAVRAIDPAVGGSGTFFASTGFQMAVGDIAFIPEPGTAGLVGMGLAAIALRRRREAQRLEIGAA